MLTTSWIMNLPSGMDEKAFDDWYLERHTDYAKRSDGLRRYAVNRAYHEQPEIAHGGAFRVAQLWWADTDELIQSFRSYSGSASRGDTYLNVTLNADVHPSMTITEDLALPTVRPMHFDLSTAGYADTPDGLATKVIAFGVLSGRGGHPDRDALGDRYATAAQELTREPRVRSHIFGRSLEHRLEIGRASFLPGKEQTYWDWSLELAFDSRTECLEVLEGEAFGHAWSFLAAQSGQTLLTVAKGQELMMSCPARPHTET